MSTTSTLSKKLAASDPEQASETQTKKKKMTVPEFRARKGGAPLVCLTAYTAHVAHLVDEQADMILVGDSLGMVIHGMPNTLGVTMEHMIMHGQAVMRGADKALVVVDSTPDRVGLTITTLSSSGSRSGKTNTKTTSLRLSTG